MTSRPSSADTTRTTCAIAGGGPAGLVLGLLLARAGVHVTVLEKHADFLRDFRGDTVHPSTLALLDDLGLASEFAALPHTRITSLTLPGPAGRRVTAVDFSRLPVRHPYVAMAPQWDLLDLLARAAAQEPTFTLLTRHEVTGVIRASDGTENRVVGVEYRGPDGPDRLYADLTVACDGRHSTIREATGLPARHHPVGFDAWWYRISTDREVGNALTPRTADGRVAIVIPREGYVQVAQLGPKGDDDEVRSRGIEHFRRRVATLLPDLAEDVASIDSMESVKHLDVRVDRLRRWHAPGVLCLGDAAHAMSPAGGVGINLAVQDAVAAARELAGPLRRGEMSGGAMSGGELSGGELRGPRGQRHLRRIQRRRMPPTVIVQSLQLVLHARLIMPALRGRDVVVPTPAARLLEHLPALAVLPAFVVGIGPRPERAPRWARGYRPAAR